MSIGQKWRVGAAMVSISTMVFLIIPFAHAQTLASPNYRFDESTLGAGGMVQSGSPSYTATSGAGDIGIGNSTSSNFQFTSGSNTPKDPYLTFAILSSTANFGDFSASTTSVGTTSFVVSNYTSYGYVVQVFGQPPTNNNHSLDAMTATNTSQVGVEQFGINLVANTSPTSLGVNPDNGQFGYGSVMPNYATPDNYRYVPGETIARAVKNSGVTVYTISYIANVAPLTPGGIYTSNQTLIVTGTY